MLARSALTVALGLLIAAAYGASLHNEFVHDDTLFMTDPRVQSLAALPRLLREPRWGFADERGAARLHLYYRPLEPFPYAAAHLLDAGRPRLSHLLSLALHLLNTLLVLALLRRWTADGAASALGAAVFAVHPALSEAVLWPAAASGLGAFACTWSIFLLNVGAPRRWWAWPVSALLLVAALLCKETGVLAPLFVVLGWLVLEPARPRPGRWAAALATFLPALALYAVLREAALGRAIPRLAHLPFTAPELALNALALLPQYAAALVWPFALCFHHDFTPVHSPWSAAVWHGGALALLGLGTALMLRRRAPAIAFGIAALFTAAAPYLILHKPADNVFAERYLYDLAPGALLALGGAAAALTRRGGRAARRALAAVAGAALLLFVAADRARTSEWRDEVTLFERTLEQSPRAEIIRVNLAVRLLRLRRYDEGIAVLEELLRFAPHYRGGRENLALLYHAAGRLDDAVAAQEAALREHPRDTTSLLNLAYFYDAQGRRFAATATHFRLLAIDPGRVDAWNNLAIIAIEEGQWHNARRAARQVLARAPADASARELLRRSGTAPPKAEGERGAETARRCARGRRLARAGRYPLAAAQLRAAAWLDEKSPLPHQYLANVYVLSGDTRAALRHQREALRRDPGNELYRRNLRALRGSTARAGRRASPGVDSAPPHP